MRGGGFGLSLIKIIKSLNPSCQIIVISDRSDFADVRQAFLNGANDFLLRQKLRYQSLAQALERVAANIRSDAIADHHRLSKMLGLIRDGQQVAADSVMRLLKKERYPLLWESWVMVYFRMDNVRHINRNLRDYERQEHANDAEFIDMFRQRIEQREKLQDDLLSVINSNVYVEHHVIFTKKHSGLLILRPMKETMLKEQCNTLMSAMVNRIHYTFSMTVSTPGKGAEDFLARYRQVIGYHSHKFYENDFCLLNAQDARSFQRLGRMESSFETRLVHSLNDREQLHEAIELILDYMREHMIEPEDVKRYFIHLIHTTAQKLDAAHKLESEQLNVYAQGVRECESVGFMRYELYRIFSAISLALSPKESSLDYVEVIQRFIKQNLSSKLTLSMIAKEVGLNESYAGRLFKKAMGKSIFQYIHEVRMENAAQLLIKTDMKVREVAAQVGMSDQLYFNKIFRRFYALSPSEYRRTHMERTKGLKEM